MRISNSKSDLEKVDSLGFFEGWPHPPSNEKFLKSLNNSSYIALAIDGERLIGFANAISDEVLTAYIPLIEVLPEHRKKGVATKLLKCILDQTKHLYMIDLCCDDSLVEYYEKRGFTKSNGMLIRNYNTL